MGNSIASRSYGRKKAKVIKLSGESFKLKTPISAEDVVKNHPGHVLFESESVKRFGIRAKPLELEEDLKPKKIYFLVELPTMPDQGDSQLQLRRPTRASSALHQMSAKDRLENLMLKRRSASDLSGVKRIELVQQKQSCSSSSSSSAAEGSGGLQVKVKLRRSQVEKLMANSKDETELAERIVDLCLDKSTKGVS